MRRENAIASVLVVFVCEFACDNVRLQARSPLLAHLSWVSM